MSIDFKRKAQNEEMGKTYEFMLKNKNLLLVLVASVAVLIIIMNLYKSNVAKTTAIAADKLYEVSKAFQDKDYAKVIELGPGYVEKYSGYGSAGDILIITSQALLKEGKVDEAKEILEKNLGSYKDFGPIEFAANNILGGIYLDKWSESKDPKMAEKSAKYYYKAAIADNGFHKDKSLYLSADSYVKAGNITKAKELLKPLYEDKEVEYQLKQQIKFLYEGLN
ncbi:MAG: hypothetical protein JXR69_02480 [Candidatus Delongbacteria bacterium]|nr:hypothetical protein [Candidatus Delongbacteria bacterium]